MAAGVTDKDTTNELKFGGKGISINSKDKVENDNVDYDELLSSAGEFGLYQIILFFSTFPFYVFGVFVYYSQLFMTEASPNHWCWIPELENLTAYERRNLGIPVDNYNYYGYSRCRVYLANWTEVLRTGVTPNDSWDTIPCQHGWEFNKSEIPYPSITSELGWVCDKNSYQATAQAIFCLGNIVGGFIIGWIADRFGRLPAVIISNIVGCVGGVTSTFARSFFEFSVCRFFMGMAYDNCMMIAYLIVLEYVSPKYRTILSNLSFALFYSLAATLFPWLMLACGHWKIMSLVTSVPLALAILAPLFLPESPRWLLSKGRIDQTIKKVLIIGRVNKKEVPSKLIDRFKQSILNTKQEENMSILELFRRPPLRNMFIGICFVYMCCSIVFDGLIRSIKQLDFDYFLTFSLESFTEFPSMLLTAFIMDWTGRRWLTVIVMSISCTFSVLTMFVSSGIMSVSFIVIARFAVNIAYGAAIQWAPEMLPISVRGSGASIVHICGSLATVLSPYVVYLENFVYWLPLVMIGCIAGCGGVVALTLPETARKDMPETFEDAENLIKSRQLWDIPFLSKKEADNSD